MLQVGTLNSTGQRYRGHYSIWITNRLQEQLVALEHVLVDPPLIEGWVNCDLYLPTSETLGILPVPPDIRAANGMAEFNPNLDCQRTHHYLAKMQGTHKAILPIHTPAEHELFHALMKSDQAFRASRSTGPNWKQCAKVWNSHADRSDGIYYKVTLTHWCRLSYC